MNQTSIQKTSISISQLLLWDENARFPDKYYKKTQDELIQHFLDKKNFKIKELATEIVKDFDLLQVEDLIVFDNGADLIVLEGNRRLATYKLLAEPGQIKDKDTRIFFQKLHNKIEINSDYRLNCAITNQKEIAERFLERKHLYKNNEIPWAENERSHFKTRRGKGNENDLLLSALSNKVQQLDLHEIFKEQILGYGNITNFTRILCSRSAREYFGLTLDENNKLKIRAKDFDKKLTIIIYDILNKKINSRTLNKKEEIDVYLQSIQPKEYKKAKDELEKSISIDLLGDETITLPVQITHPKKISRPKSTTRNSLIPKTCILVIKQKKINQIYRELRDDLLLDDSKKSVPNAVAVLFRVFLELSLDYFIEKHKSEFKIKNEAKLPAKIDSICNFFEENNFATSKQLINIRKASSDKNHLLAIENFHGYLHSYEAIPSTMDLKSKWDKLEEFFSILWDKINIKEKK